MDASELPTEAAPQSGNEGSVRLSAVSTKPPADPWSLQLESQKLVVWAEGSETSCHIPRTEMLEKVELVDGLFMQRAVSVKPLKELLKLDAAAFRALKDWMGQAFLLRSVLRTRLQWALPLGIVFVLLAIPLPGDPETGTPGMPFNWVNALLGALLIVSALFGQRHPHPHFLLLDALWWAILMAITVQGQFEGESRWWLLLIAIQLRFCYTGLRDWNRFLTGRY